MSRDRGRSRIARFSGLPPLLIPSPERLFETYHEDHWKSNPPQVTSYLVYHRKPGQKYRMKSLTRGFGWGFSMQEENPGPLLGKLHLALYLEPDKCSSMPLANFNVEVLMSCTANDKGIRKQYSGISFRDGRVSLGRYDLSVDYIGETRFEITLAFNSSDGLSLPDTSTIIAIQPLKQALCHSLDTPVFVDTKFYLFSARTEGKPSTPRAVFARSTLLLENCTYLQDLLSVETGFSGGTPCNLYNDVPEEIARLDANLFDYDSDSDLEDEDCDCDEARNESTLPDEVKADAQAGRAFAINGTAYKTWKAFVFYKYTNTMNFNPVKSQNFPAESTSGGCSPKSMYRLADYVGLSHLKHLARTQIEGSLSESNIIPELFSSFTYRYSDIVELETNFLMLNFTPEVGRELNNALQSTLFVRPQCSRVVSFIMGRLLAGNAKVAWSIVDDQSEDAPEE